MEHFATLECFLTVENSASAGLLRMATGTVYKQARAEKGLSVIDVTQPLTVGEVIPIESVESKVVFAPHDEQQGKMNVLPCFSRDL
jgi:hypothetical protein